MSHLRADDAVQMPALRASSRGLAEAIFIVPAAHSRIFDARFQTEMYELFHRTALCRLGHMTCTPAILVGVLMLASRVAIPGVGVSLGVVYVATLAASALRLDRWVGAVMLPLLAAALFGAQRASLALGPEATKVAVIVIVAGTFVQTLSHMAEDVPPPTSGAPGWVPTLDWIKTSTASRLAQISAMSAFAFTALELWASLRIWPLQVLHLLMRLGYRPDLRRALDERVREIIARPEGEWRAPRATP